MSESAFTIKKYNVEYGSRSFDWDKEVVVDFLKKSYNILLSRKMINTPFECTFYIQDEWNVVLNKWDIRYSHFKEYVSCLESLGDELSVIKQLTECIPIEIKKEIGNRLKISLESDSLIQELFLYILNNLKLWINEAAPETKDDNYLLVEWF